MMMSIQNSRGNETDDLRFQLLTWNVANTDPPGLRSIEELLGFDSNHLVDICAIGLQEIPTGVMQTARSFLQYDDWAKTLMHLLSLKGYYMVESIRMQGLSLSIFVLVKHLPFVRFIRTDLERTGFGGVWGNKGGVAISLWLYSRRICFLNTHLIPHRNHSHARVEQFKTIIDNITFGTSSSILSHDCVFWLGDLNFRISELPRADVLQSINEGRHIELLDFDQFKLEKAKEGILQEFHEADINFPPTYKFDIGTDTYDTSEKKRVPAWTDRILYREHPDYTTTVKDRKFVTTIPDTYICEENIKQSDHKPVKIQYDVTIVKRFDPLVEIAVIGKWTTHVEGKIEINLHCNFSHRYFDYIGLYQHPISDCRSYTSWIYMPNYDENQPDKLQYRLSFPRVEKAGTYVIGYYSEIQSCLLTISPSFTVVTSS